MIAFKKGVLKINQA